jgi:hypothetical protein
MNYFDLVDKVNEAAKKLSNGSVKRIESISINFPIIDDAGTPGEISFVAFGEYEGDFTRTSIPLLATPEMKSMANSLKEKAEGAAQKQISVLKDKLRDLLLKAATEV